MIKCVAIVLAAVVLAAIGDNDVPDVDQKFLQELPCLAAGGLCVLQLDCPRGKAAPRGLCPLNQDKGYECCHSVPLSERRCRYRGGECMARCPVALRLERASDCAPTEACCRLE